mmetsp:Transcript_39543/g.82137  ORF Transcript_39543/g.82137 Transcript_39543/m.82137 type:complete len:103 (+) Transcript_39543:740-1048(+)
MILLQLSCSSSFFFYHVWSCRSASCLSPSDASIQDRNMSKVSKQTDDSTIYLIVKEEMNCGLPSEREKEDRRAPAGEMVPRKKAKFSLKLSEQIPKKQTLGA